MLQTFFVDYMLQIYCNGPYGQEYVRQGEHVVEEAYRLRQVKSMAKKAASMGYKLVPVDAST